MLKLHEWFAKVSVLTVLAVLLVGCGDSNSGSSSHSSHSSRSAETFDIISGSENKMIIAIIDEFNRQNGTNIKMHFKGSVDIMLELQQANVPYDAVWPANDIWLKMGDVNKVLRHSESIWYSPVVLSMRKSKAKELGWLDKKVFMNDILEAAGQNKFSHGQTSATQSNSGCSFFVASTYALAGSPSALTTATLQNEELQKKVGLLQKHVDFTSGSSGWLMERMVEMYPTKKLDAMVNYECMLIQANRGWVHKGQQVRGLVQRNQEPLVAIYPEDGIMMANSPLAYVDKKNTAKEQLFLKLQKYLLSAPVQRKIMQAGRRTAMMSFDTSGVDKSIFNPDWNINLDKVLNPVPTPEGPVIQELLNLYQGGGLRKPSLTAYVLDYSGSMKGDRERELENAMAVLLDPENAKRYLIQASSKDIHIVVPFDGKPRKVLKTTGNKPADLLNLLTQIRGQNSQGATDIYSACAAALKEMSRVQNIEDYFPSIIVLTDGESSKNLAALNRARNRVPIGKDVPIFSIKFGNASPAQLDELARMTGARVFNAKSGNLAGAFRKAKGYN